MHLVGSGDRDLGTWFVGGAADGDGVGVDDYGDYDDDHDKFAGLDLATGWRIPHNRE